MGAIAAWNDGATGAGVTVAVIDSGIQFDSEDLAGRISPASTDVIAGRNTPQGEDTHGTYVSGVIASAFNGFGTIGVAYESTILSIRSDISDCDDPDDDICFLDSDLARAIDYAVANHVPVINMSVGGDGPLGSQFEAALSRAVNAGIVFAISSGNASGANPEWPGRYASDPRFAGSIIVVGAHDSANVLASFSNQAGVSSEAFLSAPGVDIITACEGASCWRVSGTSFSAPAVAGALALLLDAFPNLSGRDAVAILLDTARDAGSVGTDTVYGRGLLDIAQAFQPVGSTSVPLGDGTTVELTSQRFAYTGGAFGDALRRAGGLGTVGRDDYERLFRVNLGSAYGVAPRTPAPLAPAAPRRQATLVAPGPFGGALTLTSGAVVEDSGYDLAAATSVITPWLDEGRREDVLVEFSTARGGFAHWQGRNGARSPFELGASDNFASLAQVDRAWLGSVRFGALSLAADTGAGDRAMPFQAREPDVSRYARFVAGWQASPAARMRFAVGALDEKLGPLGSYAPLESGLALPSSTRFGSVAGEVSLRDDLFLNAEMGWARSDISGQFLGLTEKVMSSSWSLGLTTFCRQIGLGCRSLTWSIRQPLRVESGQFSAWLADAPAEYFDPLTFSERRFSAAPSGRQIDMSVGSLHQLPDGSWLDLRAVMTRDDQHIRSAAPTYTMMGSWRTTF